MSDAVQQLNERLAYLTHETAINIEELNSMDAPVAEKWFFDQRQDIRNRVARRARQYISYMGTDREARTLERLRRNCELLDEAEELTRLYFQQRRDREAAERAVLHQQLLREHQENKAARITARHSVITKAKKPVASRLRYSERLAAGIAAAHYNPDPLPEPIFESREERIVNNALRSSGSYVRVSTGRTLQRGKRPSQGVTRPK